MVGYGHLVTLVVELLAQRGLSSISEAMKPLGLEEVELNTCMLPLELPQPVQQSCPHTQDRQPGLEWELSWQHRAQELVDYHPLFLCWQSQAVGTVQTLEFCCCSVCSLGPQLLRDFSDVGNSSPFPWSSLFPTKCWLNSAKSIIYSTLSHGSPW